MFASTISRDLRPMFTSWSSKDVCAKSWFRGETLIDSRWIFVLIYLGFSKFVTSKYDNSINVIF